MRLEGVPKARSRYDEAHVLMRDTLYRKSAPNRELWHTEMSFDYSFCVLAAAGIVVVIATLAMLRRICRAMFCRRRRKR